VGEDGREPDETRLVDLGPLNGRDLVPAEALADDLEAARQGA